MTLGTVECNTSFRVESGPEGDFLPAPPLRCKPVVCVANSFWLSGGLEEIALCSM